MTTQRASGRNGHIQSELDVASLPEDGVFCQDKWKNLHPTVQQKCIGCTRSKSPKIKLLVKPVKVRADGGVRANFTLDPLMHTVLKINWAQDMVFV